MIFSKLLLFFATVGMFTGFLSCSPRENVDDGSSHPDTVSAIGIVDSIAPAEKVSGYPLLGSDNAEAFLVRYFDENPERNILLTTRHGTLEIQLYDDTPLHTANFLMMTKREYFSGTEFTRIVKDFVVQGGNSERETDEFKRLLIGSYLLSPEIHDKYLHRKGALAMARSYDANPAKLSSAYDFYIVVGRTFNDPQLTAMARDHEMNIPEWKRKIYRDAGGAPHLDAQHTVFGQVVSGMDVLDSMAHTPTDERNWPLQSLVMKVEVAHE